MNTIRRKLSILVLIVAAATTTAFTIGATTTFAASNTHTHDIQLMGMTHMPVNWTGDFGSGDYGDFNSAQYGGVQPDNHHSSGNVIADFNGDNSNSTVGSNDRGGFNFAQYQSSDSHSHHHKDSTAPNSSWMWPTHHTGPDIVDIS
ncbi:MAG: hypothetical protein WBZ36_26195 [Candidatus Nitrosopolaris sp.]